MLQDVSRVLVAIHDAAKRSSQFAKNLPYRISAKRSSTIVSNLSQRDPVKHKAVVAFLNSVQKDPPKFWNPNIQVSYTEEESHFLLSRGYLCVALCFSLQGAEIHHSILHRIARLVVYRLTLNGGRTARSISEDLKGAGLYDGKPLDTLIKEIKVFINAGRRYDEISTELGGPGSLFFLPHIGHSV